ncbi:pre-rRNA-processing protein TSR2-like [Tropilaelaps mercedesae]|uniref:Pre-rRNA-processing protein TSR2-like n=1 Tax=Tropilaelaps mercedesae TaxID=418985 RepID=A0A1V9WZJ0_9ACAR|nr:pre-rRNA-processing protein TSR2-like [Tropilaelaps mercedesae]
MLQLQTMCRRGQIQEALNQLPKEPPAMPNIRAEPDPVTVEDSMVVEEDVNDVANQLETLGAGEPQQRTNEPDEDGWITVRKAGGKSRTNKNDIETNR